MRGQWKCLFVLFLLLVPQLGIARQVAADSRITWVATWVSSPEAANANPNQPLLNIEGQTVRERVRVSIGGAEVCIRLSNEYGPTPLVIGAATVGAPNDPASVKPASIRTITFGGRNSVTIPAGAPALSDPVAFPVAAGDEISISLYFPKRVTTPTLHALALKRAVVSQHGDHTREEKIEGGAVSESSILVSAVLVPARPSQRLVVAFGDSVTDGDGSTVDADHNWPSELIRRLEKKDSNVGVINAGIAGNRLLSDDVISASLGTSASFGVSGLARFDRDALDLPGVTHVVILEGINDIGFPGAKLNGRYLADPADVRSPEDLISGYSQLISRAHARGIKVIGATMTPFEGVDLPGYYSEAKETTRQTINKWIRTSVSFDAVIDFDAVVRDPDHPTRILPRFASSDQLHPNDAGYRAMAEAIDLAVFR